MARANSSGLPYLLNRPDAGQFAYHRAFGSDLVPFLRGTLQPSWTSRTTPLEGRIVLKLSLGTGDKKLAATRWDEIHPLVQRYVREAEDRAAKARAAKEARRDVERLTPDEIRTMSAQVMHDVLTSHDRTYIEPDHVNDVGYVLNKVLPPDHPCKDDVQTLRACERTLRARRYNDLLRNRRLTDLNRGLVEGEVELPPDLAQRLIEDPNSLTEDERKLCFHMPMIAPETISGELDRLLTDNGLTLAPDHPSRLPLALAIARTQVRAAQIEQGREEGRIATETPPRPTPVMAVSQPVILDQPDPESCLSALLERWGQDKRPSRKQFDDKARYVKLFIGKFGDLPAVRVTPLMVSRFRDTLLLMPRNLPGDIRDASLDSVMAWMLRPENSGRRRLSRQTINAKALGALSVLMDCAKTVAFVTSNPCAGLALELKRGDKKKRVAYNTDDLELIFSHGIFAPEPRTTAGGRGPAAYWLPLLALFSGARLEELGQLLVADIRRELGIDYFDILETPDEDDEAGESGDHDEQADKNVKTPAGRRRVPIHPELKRLGFLEFVKRRRDAGQTRLFPELIYYRDRCTKNWSKFWGRFARRYVTKREDKTFHSFRHAFIRALRRKKVSETMIKALVGHSGGRDTTTGYGLDEDGSLYALEMLDEAITCVDFPGVDFTRFYGFSARLGW